LPTQENEGVVSSGPVRGFAELEQPARLSASSAPRGRSDRMVSLLLLVWVSDERIGAFSVRVGGIEACRAACFSAYATDPLRMALGGLKDGEIMVNPASQQGRNE
jgi:hypothetical protein